MKCASCGFENPQSAKFCGECGVPLAARCSKCSADNPLGFKFCAQCGNPLSRPEAAFAAGTARANDAERRQLTVMFCDLVGSTALSAKLDPEDLREVMRAYQEAVSAVVGRYDGHVAKYLGDGVLAYFGWPRAHEDNAERAVRAGLDVVKAAAGLEPRPGLRLQARVGVATGVVVAGDLRGEGVEERGAISGETANLAARLQDVAEPGAVVIGAETHQLAGALFECRDLGARNLKGFAGPIAAWSVARPLRAESRFDAMHSRHLTELVGRDEELEILLRRWQRTKTGEGQIVLISGEPGIGKSRLVHALQERIADEPHTPIRLQCSPFHVNSALYPMIEHFERAAGLAPDDDAAAKLDKLEALLAQSGPLADDVPFFAALMSIPTEGRYPPINVSAQRQKELTLNALVTRLELLAARQPVVFTLEDAHWIDPTTLEFMELVVERAPDAPVLALITYRPEFAAPWIGRPRVAPMILGRLDRRDCALLVDKVVLGRVLSDQVRDQIVAQTDGVPLFIEELTAAMLESGVGTEQSSTSRTPAVPATLRGSLEARLDRLGPAKEVAQIGAVIGREFSYALIGAVASMPREDLDRALDRLTHTGLVFQRGASPEATYTFKHALVQDVAYESLLRGRRRELHGRIADVLERRGIGSQAAEPEIIAHHFSGAAQNIKAISYWRFAGKRATERSANWEAVADFDRALEVLATLPETRDRDVHELDILVDQFSPLVASKGYTGPDAERASVRALELCQRIGDTPKLFPVLFARYSFFLGLSQPVAALEFAEEYLRGAQRAGNDTLRMMGHRMLGSCTFFAGRWAASREHLERVLAMYDDANHSGLRHHYGHDPKASAMAVRALDLWALGYPDAANACTRIARDAARAVSHPNTTCYVLAFVGIVRYQLRDVAGAEGCAWELGKVSEEFVVPFWALYAKFFSGLMRFDRGDRGDGVRIMSQALGEIPVGTWQPLWIYYGTQLADALGRSNRVDEGLAWIDRVQAISDSGGERWSDSEISRIRGNLLALIDKSVDAETSFQRAVDVARAQSAKSWELRAATRLARLWQSQGKTDEARDLLAPIYDWFTEGFDTADLKEAKALLEELA